MGVVAKQSILNTLITYLGFGLGAVNTLFLFTNILSKSDYGAFSYIIALSNLLWPFVSLGIHNTLVKYYHSNSTFTGKSRLFFSLILIPSITFTLLLLFYSCLLYTSDAADE